MITRQVKNRNLRSNENSVNQKVLTSVPYREAIGSLLHLAGTTRPDISYAVNILSRRQNQPSEEDWIEVERILRYLRGTINLGLHYKGKTETLEVMTDASFRDQESSASTSGYVIKLYGNTIVWRSHKQSSPTTSTCQAEYLAASEITKEVISLDKGVRDMIGKSMYPVTI